MIDQLNLLQLGATWIVLEWIVRIIAIFLIPINRKPSSAMAWLLVIFFLPFLGVALFLLIGSPKLPKHRQKSQKTLDKYIANAILELSKNRDANNLLNVRAPEKYQSLAKLSQSLSRLPVVAGNKAEVLPEYNEVISRIAKDIEKADHFVHLEFFIIVIDEVTEPIFAAMARAVERGVTVRVMYDSLSTRRYPGRKLMLERLKSDGVLFQAMLPFKVGKNYVRPDLRNHRKLVVIDGHVGYTGSLNLVRRDYHRKDDIYYDELVIRVQGPIVLQLGAVFVTDWFSETGELLDYKKNGNLPKTIESYGSSLAQILPSGPGYEDENNLKLFTNLIHTAQKRITIVNPYFVPDDSLITALTSAARRGVEVTMINSESMDQWMVGHAQRSFYEVLLKAGVKIYLYQSPILLHSKFITVDGDIATVGSSNLDIRSFELDLEVTLILYDKAVVKKLDTVIKTYLKRSKNITAKRWRNRSRKEILLGNIARLTSALQ